jgi:hypothetical protein
MLIDGLRGLLAGEGTVTAIIGTPSTRTDGLDGVFISLYPEKATPPRILLAEMAAKSDITFDGPSGFVTTRMGISCTGKKYGDAKQLAAAVRAFLEGLAPTFVLGDGTTIWNAFRVGEADVFEEDPFLYCTMLEMEILNSEAD